MSTLVITLPAAPAGSADSYSYTLSLDGHGVSRHGQASAALLPQPGRTGETVALVPLRALSWQRVSLPPGALAQPARLRAVLQGLLEEHLLDEPAALHFALQPGAHTGQPAWVAVCDRAWLGAALQALEAAGHPVDRVVPEFAPAASPQTELYWLGQPEDGYLVRCSPDPAQAPCLLPLPAHGPAHDPAHDLSQAAALPELLHELLHGPQPGPQHDLPPGQPTDNPTNSPTNSHATEPPRAYAEPALAALAEQLLGRAPHLQTAAERALQAARGGPDGPWELAQFELASSGGQRLLRRIGSAADRFARAPQWRAARWGLALALLVQLLGLNLWAWAERQQLAAKQASIRQLLTQTFPQVQVVVDAPLQMERELARLRQHTGSLSPQDLEPLLSAAAHALPPSQQPSGIEYHQGVLRLSGITLSPQELEPVQQQLAAQQIRASLPQSGVLQLQARDSADAPSATAALPALPAAPPGQRP